MFEVKFLYFFVYKTIVTMARKGDLTNLKDLEIQQLLWLEQDLQVDPLEDLLDGSDLEEDLIELDDSSDSSFDESCSETSPLKAQTVRLLPPRQQAPAPGRGQCCPDDIR